MRDKRLRTLKTALIETMNQHAIDSINIDYHGTGSDASGTINVITTVPANVSASVVFNDQTYSIESLLNTFVEDLINHRFPEYREQEGGEGEITLTRLPAKVTWNHTTFYIGRRKHRATTF